MSTNNRYKIYPNFHFGIAKFESGEKTFHELYDYAERIRKDKNFQSVHFHLTDLRGCTFNFEVANIKKMVNLVNKYQETDNQNLGVYLIDEPIATAYIQLFFESLKNKREICSTTERAYRLLKLPVSYSEFLTMIEI